MLKVDIFFHVADFHSLCCWPAVCVRELICFVERNSNGSSNCKTNNNNSSDNSKVTERPEFKLSWTLNVNKIHRNILTHFIERTKNMQARIEIEYWTCLFVARVECARALFHCFSHRHCGIFACSIPFILIAYRSNHDRFCCCFCCFCCCSYYCYRFPCCCWSYSRKKQCLIRWDECWNEKYTIQCRSTLNSQHTFDMRYSKFVAAPHENL